MKPNATAVVRAVAAECFRDQCDIDIALIPGCSLGEGAKENGVSTWMPCSSGART